MARDLSCAVSGKPAFKTKRDAEQFGGEGAKAKRCDHCRWWHVATKKGRRHR